MYVSLTDILTVRCSMNINNSNKTEIKDSCKGSATKMVGEIEKGLR